MTDDPKGKQRKKRDLAAQLEELRKKEARKQAKDWSPADAIMRGIRQDAPTPQAERQPKEEAAKQRPARPQHILYRRDLPSQTKGATHREPDHHVVLDEEIDGVEAWRPDRGPIFLVRRRVDEVEGAESVSSVFRDAFAAEDSGVRQRIANMTESAALEQLMFMDIETTGLDNSPLFLIGTMVWEAGGFEARQYLARNYAEEAAVISFFRDACAARKLLVTFNGKSFDVPFIRLRATATRAPLPVELAHLDLLHECRRVWRHSLPNCKLQTLERYVCGRQRVGDIPGDQIADAYHAYVRTDNAWQIVDILKHNLLDLITMADLLIRLP